MTTSATHEPRVRAVIAAVQLPEVSDIEFDASVTELRQLAKTLGFDVVEIFTQRRARFDQAAYLGAGKREELRRFVHNESTVDADGAAAAASAATKAGHAARAKRRGKPVARDSEAAVEAGSTPVEPAERRADVVLVDHEISPSQARNLEKEAGAEVMDRTTVILEIFHRHARSRAARAQVEIVRLSYMAPRLREAAKLAGPQGRQRSGVGGRGAGESRGELDRRKIRERIAELQEELLALDAERRTQRERRQARQDLARVALVGYTNAGKSTLMRALTGSEVLVADKLFATLDTTVRALHPEGVPRVLVSDTVGFIKNLPHGLVASFKSTLDEALEASLLAHVVDASDPGFERQLAVTEDVLNEIGAKDVPRMLVFNKIDRVGDPAAQAQREAALRERHPDCIVISARRPGDIDLLRGAILRFFQRGLIEAELFLPWSAQRMRGEIFAQFDVIDERVEGEGMLLRVRGEPDALQRLRDRIERLPGGSDG